MKPTLQLTPEEYERLLMKHTALRGALDGHNHGELLTIERCFDNSLGLSGSAYSFRGRYTNRLVELLGKHPDDEEIIMLVDAGYCHYGATCTVDTDLMTFKGSINVC